MDSVEVCVVGGGRMGEALVGGMIAAGRPSGTISIAEVDEARRQELEIRFPGVAVEAAPTSTTGGIVAVKPHHAADAAAALSAAGAERILSVAAGVTLDTLRAAVAPTATLVRCMPNTPALVGAGASAIAGDADGLDWAEEILAAVGLVVRVTESQLDAVTGLSGSGPAYVFLIAESLTEAGVLQGLPRPIAAALAGQTILGAAQLLAESDRGPAELRADVTSPGGTTAAGLHALETAAVRAALIDAVGAAADRSRELGRQ